MPESLLIKLQASGVSCRPQAFNLIKNETLAQAFSYEFCKIFNNAFFTEHLQATAYDDMNTCLGYDKTLFQQRKE